MRLRRQAQPVGALLAAPEPVPKAGPLCCVSDTKLQACADFTDNSDYFYTLSFTLYTFYFSFFTFTSFQNFSLKFKGQEE